MAFWVTLQHGPENLIKVEDNEEEEDGEGEEDEEYMVPVIMPAYQLVEIIDLADGEGDEPPACVK